MNASIQFGILAIINNLSKPTTIMAYAIRIASLSVTALTSPFSASLLV
jgi:hypothetical protein